MDNQSNKSIEDLMFTDALTASGLKRTQDMYEPSEYTHHCSMCGETHSEYRLKVPYVESLGLQTPYIFICEECFKELEV